MASLLTVPALVRGGFAMSMAKEEPLDLPSARGGPTDDKWGGRRLTAKTHSVLVFLLLAEPCWTGRFCRGRTVVGRALLKASGRGRTSPAGSPEGGSVGPVAAVVATSRRAR